jgi:hypothetical protein
MLAEGVPSVVDTGDGLVPCSSLPWAAGCRCKGITHLSQPEPATDVAWNYVVIGIAALFEGTSRAIALRQFGRTTTFTGGAPK